MQEKFSGFYGTNNNQEEQIWSAENTVFIFDTNALLTLYRCEKNTRDAFFTQWEKIKERVWLPFHICLEYQRNRLNAVKAHVTELENIGSETEARVKNAVSMDNFDKGFVESIKRYPELQREFTALKESFSKSIASFVEKNIHTRIAEANFFTDHDTIRDRIDSLTDSRTGEIPEADYIRKLTEEGEKRYKNKVPPGFLDEKDKKEETFFYKGTQYFAKFGDWYIWKEILELVNRETKKGVIFVSNDLKEDWIYRIAGKTRGPLEALRTELSESGNGTSLLLYSTSNFLKKSNIYLTGTKVNDETIQEMKLAETGYHPVSAGSKDDMGFDLSNLCFNFNIYETPQILNEDLDSWTKSILTEIPYKEGLNLLRLQIDELDKVIAMDSIHQIKKIKFSLAKSKLKGIERNLLKQLGEPTDF